VLVDNKVVSNDPKVRDEVVQVMHLIKTEQHTSGKMLHKFEFYPFQWVIDTNFFTKSIADAAANDQE
jgi:ABC-type polar amino acid transport system ATPase subunit